MAITFARPSAESLRELDRGVRKVSSVDTELGGRLKARARAAAAASAPLDQLPHKIYTIGLEDLVAGGGRSRLKLIGDRYILEGAEGGASAGEVYFDEGGQTHTFAEVNLGPFTRRTVEAVAFLSKSRKIQADDYEFSVIRIPALYVFAVWLQHKEPEKDLVVILDAKQPLTARRKLRTLEAFLSALRKEARKALKAQRDLAV